MSKYDPLRDYLLKQRYEEFILNFREIEEIIGDRLPDTAASSNWWANLNDAYHVQREAWRDTGYNAYYVAPDRVKFKKIDP